MNEVSKIELLGEYRIKVSFKDGYSKDIDFLPFIGGGISEKLKNPEYFSKAEIESGGGITWPNGFDFCPNFLKQYAEDL